VLWGRRWQTTPDYQHFEKPVATRCQACGGAEEMGEGSIYGLAPQRRYPTAAWLRLACPPLTV